MTACLVMGSEAYAWRGHITGEHYFFVFYFPLRHEGLWSRILSRSVPRKWVACPAGARALPGR
jgi:hypothetical protein